jgi:hypothetical protein
MDRAARRVAAAMTTSLPRRRMVEPHMTTLNIVRRLRFVAALAPALLLLAFPVIAIALYGFGATPRFMYENQLAGLRAAQEMDSALYQMEWGRYQPDGAQIVVDQQRRFIGMLESARLHVETEDQARKVEAIAELAEPLFAQVRDAHIGDETIPPQLRELHGLIGELVAANVGVVLAVAERAESWANWMILLTALVGVLVPCTGLVVILRMTARLGAALRAMREEIELASERRKEPSAALEAIDRRLAALGYPKPSPMLAE